MVSVALGAGGVLGGWSVVLFVGFLLARSVHVGPLWFVAVGLTVLATGAPGLAVGGLAFLRRPVARHAFWATLGMGLGHAAIVLNLVVALVMAIAASAAGI
jgi:hypothetical protein